MSKITKKFTVFVLSMVFVLGLVTPFKANAATNIPNVLALRSEPAEHKAIRELPIVNHGGFSTLKEMGAEQYLTNHGWVYGVSSSLNVRKSATTQSKVIGSLSPDEPVVILGNYSNWYLVKYRVTGTNTAKCGWVSSDYIMRVNPVS